MDVRFGFVTNSSSTNHVIMWRGKEEDLEKLLRAHQDKFMPQFAGAHGNDPYVPCAITIDCVLKAILECASIQSKRKCLETLAEREIYRRAWAEADGRAKGAKNPCKARMKAFDTAFAALKARPIDEFIPEWDAERLANFDWVADVPFGDEGGSITGILGEIGKETYIKFETDDLVWKMGEA